MSCLENDKIYENACERFFEALDDHKFACMIQVGWFTAQDQWMEKEYGRDNEEAYNRVFDILWKEDPEGMALNPIETAKRILKSSGAI